MKKILCIALIVAGTLAVISYNNLSAFLSIEKGERDAIAKEKAEKADYIKKTHDAMGKGDYTEAYAIVDQMIHSSYSFSGHDLNKSVLTNEIAAYVENGNVAKIILCIKERAQFNSMIGTHKDSRIEAEREMLKHAIQLAEAIDDNETAKKLQKALDSWEKAE